MRCFQKTSFQIRAAMVPRQLGHAIWVQMPPLCFTHPWSQSNAPQPVGNEISPLHYKEHACSLKLFPHRQQSHAWHTYWKSIHAASPAPPQQYRRLSLVNHHLLPSVSEQPLLSFRFQFSLPVITPFPTSSTHHVLWMPALAPATGSEKGKGGSFLVRSLHGAAAPLLVGNDFQPALCTPKNGVF